MDADLARRVMADVEGDIGFVEETNKQASQHYRALTPCRSCLAFQALLLGKDFVMDHTLRSDLCASSARL
jgi:hypothetical protein